MGASPIKPNIALRRAIFANITFCRHTCKFPGINSSNQVFEVNRAILTACKLVDLWKIGSYHNQQKIQYLVFPDGLIWDKETGKPRTTRENEALMAIRLINRQIQDNPEQEKTGKSFDFPALVAGGGLEPPTSGL